MTDKVVPHAPDTVASYECERCHKRHEDPDYDDVHVFGQVYMVDATLYYLCTECSTAAKDIVESFVDGAPVTVHNDDGSSYTWRWPEVPERDTSLDATYNVQADPMTKKALPGEAVFTLRGRDLLA